MDRDVEVADETADNDDLLSVFLAKEGFIGTSDVHQFRNDRSDAAEMDRTLSPAEFMGNVAVDVDIRAITFRIHFRRFRMEDGIDTDAFQLLAVFIEAARISVIIFVRAELGRVDEDRSDDDVAFGFGSPHQGQMTFVESPHGRDQTDDLTSFFLFTSKCLHFFDSTENFHDTKTPLEYELMSRNTRFIDRQGAGLFFGFFIAAREEIGHDGPGNVVPYAEDSAGDSRCRVEI